MQTEDNTEKQNTGYLRAILEAILTGLGLLEKYEKRLAALERVGKWLITLIVFIVATVFGINLVNYISPKEEESFYGEMIRGYGYEPTQQDAELALEAGNEEVVRIFMTGGILPRSEKAEEIISKSSSSGLMNKAIGAYLEGLRKRKDVPANSLAASYNYAIYIFDGTYELSNDTLRLEDFCNGLKRFEVAKSKYLNSETSLNIGNCLNAFKTKEVVASLQDAMKFFKIYYTLDQSVSLQSIPRTIVDVSDSQRIELLRKFLSRSN